MRAGRLFPGIYGVQTKRHRWSVHGHLWLHHWNWLRLNRQPSFTDLRIARCVVLTHSKIGRFVAEPCDCDCGSADCKRWPR